MFLRLVKSILIVVSLFTAVPTFADLITPKGNTLSIKQSYETGASQIGILNTGQNAKLLGEAGRYYYVEMENGDKGYASKGHSERIYTKEILTLVTWNLEGPSGIDNKDLIGFSNFAKNADAIVLEETLGMEQTTAAVKAMGQNGVHIAISDFAKDSYQYPYKKQELAILSSHALSNTVEVDPYSQDDSPEMEARDIDFTVPDWIPESQRNKKGARGWLWTDIERLQLTVIAVHLKSSQGASGYKDKDNSQKREAVVSAIAEAIISDSKSRPFWSYVITGDFNVAPTDLGKIGIDLNKSCSENDCTGYDQTHAILGSGLANGFAMRNLVLGLGSSYAGGDFAKSPIDNVYAYGPLFDQATKVIAERGDTFGSDHYALKVTIEY
jgi:endonuclease/exonuclease/phosphatase family metal-dependent hydrolase